MKKLLAVFSFVVCVCSAYATTVIPISDAELYRRADVIVLGTVMSSDVHADAQGRPETVTVISPLEVMKGRLAADLTLHQLGGELPDGRFMKIWGRPEYRVGSEVLVFAISRPEGDFQTAELMLGKFEIFKDQQNRRFAIPDFERGVYEGVVIYRGQADPSADGSRDLATFLAFLRGGAKSVEKVRVPTGPLTSVDGGSGGLHIQPNWGNMNDQLWRWNNGATAVWQREGTALMTGGGNAEAIAAMATWTNDPNSVINYTDGSSANFVHLNAASSPCGWSSCFPATGGVIGCGGPSGSGTHTYRSETYSTITGGEVWLRCYTTFDEVGSTVTQAVLTHELGHTLGLGHADQNVSVHDVCRGDESLAIMMSVVPARTTLGTDDLDGVRWLYGDGGNHCTAVTGPPTLTSISPTSGINTGGVTVTMNGSNYDSSTLASLGGVLIPVTVVNSGVVSVSAPVLSPGTLNNAAISTTGGNALLTNAYLADFLDVPQSHIFHSYVEKIFRDGITAGCGAGNYCPDTVVTRDQMAIFILRGEHGGAYAPPAATGTMFGDVPANAFGAAFIEELANEGITGGCGNGDYCPGNPVLRSQMAIFLLRGEHGSAYAPPAATGTMFADVPTTAFAAAWIEQLARESISSGCDATHFCPNASTTRGQMAVFLVRAFSLP